MSLIIVVNVIMFDHAVNVIMFDHAVGANGLPTMLFLQWANRGQCQHAAMHALTLWQA